MKKSTILILCIVYLASILVVGIFGMKVKSYNTSIYIEEIKPTEIAVSTDEEVELKWSENGYHYAVYKYVDGLKLRMGYEILPADATNKKVSISIIYDSSLDPDEPTATYDKSANVLQFNKAGIVDVLYTCLDGSGKSMKIRIVTR